MWGIDVNNISKTISLSDGKKEVVFENFSLKVGESEVLGVYGPNGCGKTTLLNMISGLVKPDSGEITVSPGKMGNGIAYIFQDFRNSLFPWMTVKDNIVFPLSLRKIKKKDINDRLDMIISTIKIPFDLSKYPYQLSGGQQQYIAILRGLISEPGAMLIDEPFSALDHSNGMWLMEKIAKVLYDVKIPAVVVAHDIEHLMYIADRICFLSEKPTGIVMEKLINLDGLKGKSGLDKSAIGELILQRRLH